MRLLTSESTGPAATEEQQSFDTFATKSTALPFGQDIALSDLAGPTYLTAQTLVQQVAYALSDNIFAYSPESFDLDIAAQAWRQSKEKNAYGDVTTVKSLETRNGAGTIALGYMFYPGFDMAKRHRPQSIVASAASLTHLRPVLDELSLLYDVASPTVLQIAAVDYAPETQAGLVTDYSSALSVAEELGLGLVSSKSAYEVQHMSLLATLLATVQPTIHTYDGITVGRETTRVVDVLSTSSLKRTHDAVLTGVKESLSSKKLTNEGKLAKIIASFNEELGTEYKCFEYSGHAEPTSVMVVFGTVEASLGAQVAEALSKQDERVGVINVRVYRPFAEEEFLETLATTVQQIAVLGQVYDQASVADGCVSSALYGDVLAAVNFATTASGKQPSVYDIKYSRQTVWTTKKMEALFRQLGKKPGDESVDNTAPLGLTSDETKQYAFWDIAASQSSSAPLMIGQLLSGDSALNVSVRSSHDNFVQSGVVRTDIRCSPKSIEAAYSVDTADVVVIGDVRLLSEFNVINSVKDNGSLIVKSAGWKDEDIEKKLSTPVRKAIAAKSLALYVLVPTASSTVADEPELESYLLQLAFLKIANPSLYDVGLQKLQASGDTLDSLAKDLESALKKVEVPEGWLTVELEENQALPPAEDLNANSFAAVKQEETDAPARTKSWTVAAKGLLFKEVYGTATSLRPDLPQKTAVIHVKEHRRLTPMTYDRNIFHIEFDLGDSGLKYDIGEALGIHAINDVAEVNEFIKWYGLDGDEVVEVISREDPDTYEARTVYQALLHNVDIFGRPPKRFYEALSHFASDPAEQKDLLMLGTGGNQESVVEFKRRAEVDTVTFADILLQYPSAHPSMHDIVKIVAPMKRREYSVASSQKVTPNSISLLIVTVNWVDPKGRDRFGQATRYLDRLPIGAPVTVSVKPSVMKLPAKTTSPLIMAGLGTGLAPFRAFVQERAWQKQQGMEIGPVLLYMGSRHQREEYLYGEEWEAYRDAGIITLLGRAFSRDQKEKIYIQDRMRETLTEIRKGYLEMEGTFYLCGPTWPVPDVTNVLEEAVVVQGGVEGKKRDGMKEIERLKEEGRYVLEVY